MTMMGTGMGVGDDGSLTKRQINEEKEKPKKRNQTNFG
jgi:hypothetical protein